MRIVGVGDNVLDRYVDQGLMYPGGNAVNVPVLALRFGAEAAAYVGAVGDDEGGSWLLEALGLEGLDTSRVKVLPERNSYSRVALVDGDRTFVGGEKGASSKRSEEHTSELQSHDDLVCRLLLEKKNKRMKAAIY